VGVVGTLTVCVELPEDSFHEDLVVGWEALTLPCAGEAFEVRMEVVEGMEIEVLV